MNYEASARVVIDLPKDQVWAMLQDLTLAHRYVPGVLRCELHDGPTSGVGASRRVFQKFGRWLDESVVEWNEGRGFVLRLHRGEKGAPVPFRQAQFRYQIDDAGNSQTAFTARLSFSMRWGRVGAWLYQRLMRGPVNRMIRDVAAGMKDFYESQAHVPADVVRELD